MEISSETKVKVLVQYLGQMLNIKSSKTNEFVRLDLHRLQHISEFNQWQAKLILNHLSNITESDLHEVSNICATLSPGSVINSILKKTTYMLLVDKTIELSQFLISKGYDLPNYLLDGKTLQQAGLAVYEVN